MEKTVVVGFGYKSRHGKDESIQAIIEARGNKYDVRKYGFGDALKQEINDAAVAAGGMVELFKQGGVKEGVGLDQTFTPFPAWVQYDQDAPMDDPLSPLGKQRTLLQWWGTEFRRAQDANYWVKKMKETLLAEQPRIALICDMRFPNEVSWVKSDPASGFTVRVDRIGYDNKLDHASEHMLDFMAEEDWHFIIQVPDGSVEELRRDAIVVFDLIVELLTPPDLSEIEAFEEKQVVTDSVAS